MFANDKELEKFPLGYQYFLIICQWLKSYALVQVWIYTTQTKLRILNHHLVNNHWSSHTYRKHINSNLNYWSIWFEVSNIMSWMKKFRIVNYPNINICFSVCSNFVKNWNIFYALISRTRNFFPSVKFLRFLTLLLNGSIIIVSLIFIHKNFTNLFRFL